MKYGICLRCEFCRTSEGDSALDVFEEIAAKRLSGQEEMEQFTKNGFLCRRYPTKSPNGYVVFPIVAAKLVYCAEIGCGEFSNIEDEEIEG